MITENSQKSQQLLYCEKCDYKCSRKSDYNKHLLTSKHQNNDGQLHKTLTTLKKYVCSCGKEYSYRQGLYLHKKTCENKEEYIYKNEVILNTDPIKSESTDKELINYLIKENQDFKNLILEIVKKDSYNNCNNITTTNSHNKTFNLQFFLNETCKNAMNISDFVDSIKFQLSDLENVAKIGYVEGLSKIIIKNLKALDVTERPVHCSDSKRDTMYVKDEDKWEKENENNHKVLKAIEDIANKNSKMVKEWKTKNPECASSKSHKADVYSHIMIQAVCSNNDANNSKILKKIAKEVTIDKS
jgi:hypothetical protein